jgi:hypothetical protein
MGTYGKILGIANIVALVAFLWLAGLDYGKRQSWQLAVREQEILLHGLPVDEKEVDAQGRPMVSTINKKMEDQLFQGLGEPVKTARKEVELRQTALKRGVDSEQGEPAKRNKLASELLPMARSLSQREQWKERIGNAKIDELMGPEGPLEEAYREALTGKNARGQDLDADGWRHSMAHVLVNSTQSQDLQRAVIAVGLESYIGELNTQATALEKMDSEIKAAMGRDRAAWDLQQRELVRQIVALSERVQALDNSLQKQKDLHDQEHQPQVQARKANVEQLKQAIAKAQNRLKTVLATEDELKTELADANKGLADAKSKNERLEGQLKDRAARAAR